MKRHPVVLLTLVLAACALNRPARSQALATATGPGSFVTAGGGFSAFQTDYGYNTLAGGFLYVDVHPQWRIGFEGEARYLRWHANEEVTETNYLGGLRVQLPVRCKGCEPYAKFLAGAGEITLPFNYAHGGFLTYAPGAGLDISLNDRIIIRAIDVEYQHWPAFTYGALSPYGLSAGVSMRLNGISRYPRGARATK